MPSLPLLLQRTRQTVLRCTPPSCHRQGAVTACTKFLNALWPPPPPPPPLCVNPPLRSLSSNHSMASAVRLLMHCNWPCVDGRSQTQVAGTFGWWQSTLDKHPVKMPGVCSARPSTMLRGNPLVLHQGCMMKMVTQRRGLCSHIQPRTGGVVCTTRSASTMKEATLLY